MEEGGGEDGDECCTFDVPEFVCQGVSVLVMGSSSSFSSYDEAPLLGWTGNVLTYAWSASLDSVQNRLGRSWGLTPFSFLAANIEQGSSTLALVSRADRLCSCGVLPLCLSPLQSYGLGIDIVILDPAGTETLLRRIYAERKYSHIHALNISTCRN